MVNDVADGVADFGQVMGGHIGGHTHCDAGGAVDQQVWHPRRQHLRLFDGVVKVVGKVHRLLVDVGQHFVGDGGQAGFGVAHSRRGVAVNAAEIALPVNQGGAHGEGLGHPHQSVVHRIVAVGVEFAQHFADDAGAFAILAARTDAHIVHCVEDPALHRLQAVAHVRQGPGHDDAHSVGQIRFAHFVLDGAGGVFAADLR